MLTINGFVEKSTPQWGGRRSGNCVKKPGPQSFTFRAMRNQVKGVSRAKMVCPQFVTFRGEWRHARQGVQGRKVHAHNVSPFVGANLTRRVGLGRMVMPTICHSSPRSKDAATNLENRSFWGFSKRRFVNSQLSVVLLLVSNLR
jgi:hypothetical protein